MLARVLQARDRGLTMVFCQTKRAADQVATALASRGFAVATVHGDLGQGQRERALRAFRSGKVDVLTATEVAARGLDVDDVTHVVNYECPDDEKTYVHRIGRTGRAGRTRRRGHVRRLAGHAPLEAHQRRPRPRPARTRRDVLHLRAPVHRAGHPARGDRDAARARCGTGPAWRPRRSRTSARPARSARRAPGASAARRAARAVRSRRYLRSRRRCRRRRVRSGCVRARCRADRRGGPAGRQPAAAAPPDPGGPRDRAGPERSRRHRGRRPPDPCGSGRSRRR